MRTLRIRENVDVYSSKKCIYLTKHQGVSPWNGPDIGPILTSTSHRLRTGRELADSVLVCHTAPHNASDRPAGHYNSRSALPDCPKMPEDHQQDITSVRFRILQYRGHVSHLVFRVLRFFSSWSAKKWKTPKNVQRRPTDPLLLPWSPRNHVQDACNPTIEISVTSTIFAKPLRKNDILL